MSAPPRYSRINSPEPARYAVHNGQVHEVGPAQPQSYGPPGFSSQSYMPQPQPHLSYFPGYPSMQHAAGFAPTPTGYQNPFGSLQPYQEPTPIYQQLPPPQQTYYHPIPPIPFYQQPQPYYQPQVQLQQQPQPQLQSYYPSPFPPSLPPTLQTPQSILSQQDVGPDISLLPPDYVLIPGTYVAIPKEWLKSETNVELKDFLKRLYRAMNQNPEAKKQMRKVIRTGLIILRRMLN